MGVQDLDPGQNPGSSAVFTLGREGAAPGITMDTEGNLTLLGTLTGGGVSAGGGFRGTWSSLTAYTAGDVVVYGNALWGAKQASAASVPRGGRLFPQYVLPITADNADATLNWVWGTQFSGAFDFEVSGVAYYKGKANTGTHIGRLWLNSGPTELANATFAGETSQGWQTVTFAAPVACLASTAYTAAVDMPVGHYGYNFDRPTWPTAIGPISYAQNRYRQGVAGAFPSNADPDGTSWVTPIIRESADWALLSYL